MNIVVFDNRAGKVKTVMQPIVGEDLQSLGLIHIANNSAAGEGIEDAFHPVGGLRPDPVGKFLFGADVIGDVGRQVACGVDGVIVRRECLRMMQFSFGFKQKIYMLLFGGQGFG